MSPDDRFDRFDRVDGVDGAASVPVTVVRLTGAAARDELPLLVLGPETGFSALDLWVDVGTALDGALDVVAWDLPGHGYNAPLAAGRDAVTAEALATGVQRVVDDLQAQRGDLGGAYAHAGIGIGGEVGLHLRSRTPDRVPTALALDDVPPGERERVLRRELLGEDDGGAAPPRRHLDERSRSLVALVAAAASGRPLDDLADAARSAGLSQQQVDEALRQTAGMLEEETG